MPSYDYQCIKCKHVQEEFHSIIASPEIKCDKCGNKTIRLISGQAGIIFKGSGFYVTDYKHVAERNEAVKKIEEGAKRGDTNMLRDIVGTGRKTKRVEKQVKSKVCKR